MICAAILAVVMMTVSAQIHSLSAIFMYDVYQTYISPVSKLSLTRSATLTDFREDEIVRFLAYNRRSVYVRHVATVFFSVLTFPVAVALMAIQTSTELPLVLMFVVVGIITVSAVAPVCLSVTWHRTTGLGVVSGMVTGLAAGIAGWLVFTMSFSGGLENFIQNAFRPDVMNAALAIAFVGGGLVCIMISLCCGGLARGRHEEIEWEKCRSLDNPVKPWGLQYAADTTDGKYIAYTETPSYYKVGDLRPNSIKRICLSGEKS